MNFFSRLGALLANLVARVSGHTPAPIPATSYPGASYLPNAPIARTDPLPPAAAPAAPAAVAATPAPVAQARIQSVQEGAYRIDLPAAPGTPGTVTLEKTGHVLSLPTPFTGEMFPGYASRVYKQAGYPVNNIVGELFQGTGPWFERFGGFKADGSNWPDAADYFYDTRLGGTAYQTTDEIAYNHALMVRDQLAASKVFNGGFPVAQLTLEDKFFLYASAGKNGVPNNVHYMVLSGTSLEIRQAINDAGSTNTALAGMYDVSKYTGPLLAAVNALKS